MLKWIFVLLVVALIAAILGLGGIAHLAASSALFIAVVLVVGIGLAFLVSVSVYRRLI